MRVPAAAEVIHRSPAALRAYPRLYPRAKSRLKCLARACHRTAMVLATSMFSLALAGLLASTVLRGLHARLLGMSFGPIDTIYLAAGVLALLGGLYALVMLGGVRLAAARGGPPAADADDALEHDVAQHGTQWRGRWVRRRNGRCKNRAVIPRHAACALRTAAARLPKKAGACTSSSTGSAMSAIRLVRRIAGSWAPKVSV